MRSFEKRNNLHASGSAVRNREEPVRGWQLVPPNLLSECRKVGIVWSCANYMANMH